MNKNIVVLLGIDTIRSKNVYQLECLNKNGFIAHIFTNDILGDSSKYVKKPNELFFLEKSFFKRIFQILKYLKKKVIFII